MHMKKTATAEQGAATGIFILILLLLFTFVPMAGANPPVRAIVIGLDADLSAASAPAGQSIRRGALVAMHEINARGGILGRSMVLEPRDHRGNPARAIENMAELAKIPDLVAVLGGLHTPCALEVLPLVHEQGIPFLIPWASGTAIVENGRSPNFVFRISVCDSHAGPFLVDSALTTGYRRMGLLLENTEWGRSNHAAMTDAALARNLAKSPVEWFNWGTKDLTQQLVSLHSRGVEVILLAANPTEGLVLIHSLTSLPIRDRLSFISHWGITGGDFPVQAGSDLHSFNIRFLQSFNFSRPPFPERAAALFKVHQGLFPEFRDPLDIPAAPGLAHAYDLIHLLARAIAVAGTTDRARVRDALETIPFHSGLMADYHPPFTPLRHDALGPESFLLARYNEIGQIVPIPSEKGTP